MTMPYCIQVGEKLNEVQIDSIKSVIATTFSEIDQIYNNWNPHSEISQLNRLEANQKIPISHELSHFLKKVETLVVETEGRFDPTVAPLCTLWKEALILGTLPDQNTLSLCAEAIGWDRIHCEAGLFWKENGLTALDLGGIAKGYGVDLIVERLEQSGFSQIYVEWGGEIRTLGSHPSGRPWNIGILGGGTLPLSNKAIATSGSYIQNWEVDGVNYTHIIDPHTLQPLHPSQISSASVLAPTCLEADALATAFMLFPTQQEALHWAAARAIPLFLW